MTPFFDEGVVGLGYVQRVPRAQLDAVEARIRSTGRPEFTAEHLGQKPEVFLVTEIEPLARNRAALGKDVGAGTTRRGAAEQTMRTGAPVITHRIGLIEGARTEPGCLLFLPVYAPEKAPGDTAARARAALGPAGGATAGAGLGRQSRGNGTTRSPPGPALTAGANGARAASTWAAT